MEVQEYGIGLQVFPSMGNVDGFFFDGNPGPDGNPINNFGRQLAEEGSRSGEFCWQTTS